MSATQTLNKKIPAHLLKYVAKQDYTQYTPVNQAVWRYVMRQNYHFLKDRAHSAYRNGLQKSGILMERIPRVEEMDACLQPFGWGAVPIDGLIPGVAFFDFQAHGLLPIATDIRTLEHISYTPAPDIIHEAAGHAPILCDETYAHYVKLFGKIGRNALASKEEHEVFQATRHLSKLMEDPNSTPDIIAAAEKELQEKVEQSDVISEATQISRLYWWTVEYGLIGDCDRPSIYGAGLLSSTGESRHCLSDQVKKLPFDLETCIQTDYDVTRPQPQLFVCKDFGQLIEAVELFSRRMAFKTGGTQGLIKAVRSGDTATAEYSSGLQVSGTFDKLTFDDHGEAVYLQTMGPTALAHGGKELPGHGKAMHSDGFGSPVGKAKGFHKPLELLSPADLHLYDIHIGSKIEWNFESGIRVHGVIKDWICRQNRILLLTLSSCTVVYRDKILFRPEWGDYDLAVGEKITSVFAGAADPEQFFADVVEHEQQSGQTHQLPSLSTLDHLYRAVRYVREGKESITILPTIVRTLNDLYPEDWLLRIEILELLAQTPLFAKHPIKKQVEEHLLQLTEKKPRLKSLIDNGMKLVNFC
ncbi:aromatic amino acid hydroxylase [Paenactinomyces guangxiensis]|uniref:Aromatic amino acid hydroxylase n=1 Tax=Paenactinomyces guangxiensis TaxID=1490290 RepID=A0A7W2A7H6_9BACL|nr:aromatic amino acid hydroxylase [Paenactinomyces guangxiensis]MBA4492798.1 aromatic amino acid hydroxylase [Paenactinomyces guangxiensis]MBH8590353.1 aromatic amino acid hydroxylase [Paenactinomyces guangxiensis]